MSKPKIENRKKEIKERKNFFPSLIVTILLWAFIFAIFFLTSPTQTNVLILFFVVLLLALIFSFSLLFSNTKRGILYSLSIIIFLIMRLFGVGNILNFLLLLGFTISLDIYFGRL